MKVITLCGSTRFKIAFNEWNARLTAEERAIVLSIAPWSPAARIDPPEELKLDLDAIHKAKIDLSHEVFVLDVGGYIGPSTRSEIVHAQRMGKTVRYLSKEFPTWTEEQCRYWVPEGKETSAPSGPPAAVWCSPTIGRSFGWVEWGYGHWNAGDRHGGEKYVRASLIEPNANNAVQMLEEIARQMNDGMLQSHIGTRDLRAEIAEALRGSQRAAREQGDR